jgi:formate hydrogenlyase subunit 6/NADH:ubiquinone oxidoreductase subunit I
MNWSSVFRGFSTACKGMGLTLRHLLQAGKRRKIQDIREEHYFKDNKGLSTLIYPYESIPVPDNGRYLLHNEIEDCIVCDKCAKICPVNCIDIEPIRSATEFGKTSDGTSKRIYAARFDIDMAKCFFCGLCTTVCPTECLIMTPEYDAPVLDLGKLNFGFGNMSEEEAELRRREWEEDKARKEAAKQLAAAENSGEKSKPLRPAAATGTEAPALKPGPRPSPFPRPARPGNETA